MSLLYNLCDSGVMLALAALGAAMFAYLLIMRAIKTGKGKRLKIDKGD